MTDYARYAIYYAPPAGSALWDFGAAWMGWDAEAGAKTDRPPIEGLPEPVERLTARAARYGFHGTLRAPFRLREGLSQKALSAALFDFCEDEAGFEGPRLALSNDLGFVCLRPTEPSEALSDLAMGCVRSFQGFAAPLSEDELARRRAAGLSPRQEELLTRWGYPYVSDEFRFHMTLTHGLPTEHAATVIEALGPRLADALAEPMPVRELCLYGDPGGGAHFRLIRRFPLKG